MALIIRDDRQMKALKGRPSNIIPVNRPSWRVYHNALGAISVDRLTIGPNDKRHEMSYFLRSD